ncbi:MAG TPA: hypothetical protein VHX38_34280 [Pseudonocardiaceae bacterium]|jgi:uncharacterized membrane protein YagU involved in acid resistance|nr:hypothetical protein [Pseudonocardiaceae bacterium]
MTTSTVTPPDTRGSAMPRAATGPFAGTGAGALAGFVGGLVFGASMAVFGMLPTVASIVHTDSVVAGFVVHMVFAVVIGAGFGVFAVRQRIRVGETMFWGLIYGAFWWFLGPQTLLPLFRGLPVAWTLAGAQALLPSLIGHLVYGLVVAVVFVLIRRDHAATATEPFVGPTIRGAVAGALAALLTNALAGPAAGGLGTDVVVGVLAGVAYPLLFTPQPEGTGPALARGSVYGFVVWLVVDLTAGPLALGGRLAWSASSAGDRVSQLPGRVLLGGLIAVLFTWLGAAGRRLFTDDVRALPVEPPGERGLRATGYGIVAGVVGGLLFTVVMVGVGALPRVAEMVGSHAPAVGLTLHLLISAAIGISYAVVFRRAAFDVLSGIGWGVSYGFFWWILGDLTLLPTLDGQSVRWDAATIASQFPSLVGHLAYGAALGAVYYWLETRTNPWWMTRNTAETIRAAARKNQTLGAAPALWVLTIIIALTLPVLVGTG